MKEGYKTTEFWLSAITGLAVAIVAILAGYNVITSAQGDLWVGLVIATVPIALALISMAYSNGRSRVKTAEQEKAVWSILETKED